jgi:hypothetical protein
MKFAEMVSSLLKSLTEGGQKQDTEDEPELDEDNLRAGTDQLKDVTDIMKALVSEIAAMNKSLETLITGQGDMGEAVVGVAQMVSRIAHTPIAPKSVMAKGGLTTGAAGTSFLPQGTDRPTWTEFERAQEILVKSYKAGEISLEKSELISSDMQKAVLIPGHTMKPEHFDFLASKMRTA